MIVKVLTLILALVAFLSFLPATRHHVTFAILHVWKKLCQITMGAVTIMSLAAGHLVASLFLVRVLSFVILVPLMWLIILTGYGTLIIWPELEAINRRSMGSAVFDVQNRFLGIITDVFYGAANSQSHKMLPVVEAPAAFAACLIQLEDRRFGSWRQPFGLDVPGLFAALTGQRGGSTLPMQLARSMAHRSPGADRTFLDLIQRKWFELAAATAIWWHLDEDTQKQWLSNHVPLVNGVPNSGMGGSIYGVKLAAKLLFNKEPEELSPAEQYMMAAAFLRPILLSPANDASGLALRDKVWQQAKERAARCTEFPIPGVDPVKTRRELERLPPPEPHIDPDLLKVLPNDPHERFIVMANPAKRAQYFAPLMRATVAQSQDRYGTDWQDDVRSVRLTVDAVAHRYFARSIERSVAEVEKHLKNKLLMPLTTGRNRAQIVASIADENGRIVHYFDNTGDPFYFGSASKRVGGHYQPEREDRFLGSVTKLPALLAIAPFDTEHTLYCNLYNKAVPRRGRNIGFLNCRDPRAWVTARDAIAQSMNLPLIWRVSQINEDDLRSLTNYLGFVLPADTPVPVALVMGMAAATPQRLQRAMHLIAQGILGLSGGNQGENSVNQDETGMPPSGRRAGVARPESRRRHRRLSNRRGRRWWER